MSEYVVPLRGDKGLILSTPTKPWLNQPGLLSFKELVMTKADYRQLSKALGEPRKQLKRLGFSIMRVHDKPSTVDGKIWVVRSFTNEERVVTHD